MSLEMKVHAPTFDIDKLNFDVKETKGIVTLKVSTLCVARMYTLEKDNFSVSSVLEKLTNDINDIYLCLADDLGNTVYVTNLLISQLAYETISKNKDTFEVFFDTQLNKADYSQKINRIKKFARDTFGQDVTITYNDTSITFNNDSSLGYIVKVNVKNKTINTNTPGFIDLPDDKKQVINNFLLTVL